MRAEKLIPHRGPMLLIDRLTRRDGSRAAATARLERDSIFLHSDHTILPEYFIEIMAQAMAAANGYDALQNQAPPGEGFIVGIDGFRLHQWVKGPAEFSIGVTTTLEFGTMKVMEATVMLATTLVASAEIKVWEQPLEKE